MIDIDKHKTTLTIRSTLQSRLHHRNLMIPLFSQQALSRSITIAMRDKLEPAPISDFPKRANRFFLILVHSTTLTTGSGFWLGTKFGDPKPSGSGLKVDCVAVCVNQCYTRRVGSVNRQKWIECSARKRSFSFIF